MPGLIPLLREARWKREKAVKRPCVFVLSDAIMLSRFDRFAGTFSQRTLRLGGDSSELTPFSEKQFKAPHLQTLIRDRDCLTEPLNPVNVSEASDALHHSLPDFSRQTAMSAVPHGRSPTIGPTLNLSSLLEN
jgi:hypothetical protein